MAARPIITPAQRARPTARRSTPSSARRATSTASSTGTRPCATRPGRPTCWRLTTTTACIPTWRATRRWRRPFRSRSSRRDKNPISPRHGSRFARPSVNSCRGPDSSGGSDVLAPKTKAKAVGALGSIWTPAFAGEVGRWVSLIGLALAATAAHASPKPVIAVTWDDLPTHSALPPGVTRVQIAADLLKASADAKAPAFGFINGVQTEREPASAPVLKMWRDAGQPLGNHTWSHPNLAALTPEQFTAEIAQNEPMLKDLMRGKDWRWLRYPFLSEGDTPEKKLAVRQWLAANHYKIASVTMSFDDWAFNEPYARCAAKGDEAAIAELEKRYLDGAAAMADRSRAMAKTLYGKDIPYVLLMHAGALDARLAPRLFQLYRDKGFRSEEHT